MQTNRVLLILALLCGCTSSQVPTPTSVEDLIRSLDDQARVAAINRDIPALERLWSEQLTVNAPDNTVVVGRHAVLDGYVRSGVIDFAKFERSIEFIQVDEPFAVIMGEETVIPNSNAPSSGLVAGQMIRRRVTNIWRKEADTWRLYWRHANVVRDR
jgi:ketosteroid isomerase-like protein